MKSAKFSSLIGLTAACTLYASPLIGQDQAEEIERVSGLPPVTGPRYIFYPRQVMDLCMKRQNDARFCVDFVRSRYHEEREKDNETVSEPLLHSNSVSSSSAGCLGSEIHECIKILNLTGKVAESYSDIENELSKLSQPDVMGKVKDESKSIRVHYSITPTTRFTVSLLTGGDGVIRSSTIRMPRSLDLINTEQEYNASYIYELTTSMIGSCFSEDRLGVYRALQGTLKESMDRGSRSLWTTSTGGNDSIKHQSKKFKTCNSRLVYFSEEGSSTAHVGLYNTFGKFSKHELVFYTVF